MNEDSNPKRFQKKPIVKKVVKNIKAMDDFENNIEKPIESEVKEENNTENNETQRIECIENIAIQTTTETGTGTSKENSSEVQSQKSSKTPTKVHMRKTTPVVKQIEAEDDEFIDDSDINRFQKADTNEETYEEHNQYSNGYDHNEFSNEQIDFPTPNPNTPNQINTRENKNGDEGDLEIPKNSRHLFPLKPENLAEVVSLAVPASRSDKVFGPLIEMILSTGQYSFRDAFLSLNEDAVCDCLGITDEWYKYYLKQFLLYDEHCDYYEAWEILVMGLFQEHNQVNSLKLPAPLQSDRFDLLNPTRIILEITQRNFSSEPHFFLTFLYLLAKGKFHKSLEGPLVSDYFKSGQIEESSGLLSLFMLISPDCVTIGPVLNSFTSLCSSSSLLFLVGSAVSLYLQKSQRVHMSLGLAKYAIDHGMVDQSEGYIKYISNNRVDSQLESGSFVEEFRNVRQKYYQSIENTTGNGSTTGSGLGSMFGGLVKGLVEGISIPNIGAAKSTVKPTAEEELKWDPIAKRWLINGVIPPDDPDDVKPDETMKVSRPPPKSIQKSAVSKEEAPKRQNLNQKQKFVAYKIGANK